MCSWVEIRSAYIKSGDLRLKNQAVVGIDNTRWALRRPEGRIIRIDAGFCLQLKWN